MSNNIIQGHWGKRNILPDFGTGMTEWWDPADDSTLGFSGSDPTNLLNFKSKIGRTTLQCVSSNKHVLITPNTGGRLTQQAFRIPESRAGLFRSSSIQNSPSSSAGFSFAFVFAHPGGTAVEQVMDIISTTRFNIGGDSVAFYLPPTGVRAEVRYSDAPKVAVEKGYVVLFTAKLLNGVLNIWPHINGARVGGGPFPSQKSVPSRNSQNSYFNGKIIDLQYGEMMMWNRCLDAKESDDVQKYLMLKWFDGLLPKEQEQYKQLDDHVYVPGSQPPSTGGTTGGGSTTTTSTTAQYYTLSWNTQRYVATSWHMMWYGTDSTHTSPIWHSNAWGSGSHTWPAMSTYGNMSSWKVVFNTGRSVSIPAAGGRITRHN